MTVTVDTVPPQITIVQPQDGATTASAININITYSDSVSGIDLNSLVVYHNNDDITSELNKQPNSATGTRTATVGGNVINAWISDNAGNSAFDSALVLLEDGAPPIINVISPLDGGSYPTTTVFFQIEFYDQGSAVDLNSLLIRVNGIDRTSEFNLTGSAWWWPEPGVLPLGGNTLYVEIKDVFNHLANTLVSFSVAQTLPTCAVTQIDPNFTIGGDSVTITGTGFGNTVNVYFSGTLEGVTAEIIPPHTSTEIKVYVPGSAVAGPVWVESPAGSGNRCTGVNFTMGLPYAYITNRNSHRITVIDYRDNSVVKSILIPGTTPTPYSADVTPDGRWVIIVNRATNNATIIDVLDNNTIEQANVRIQCGSPTPTYPQVIAISPDGSHALIGSNNRVITTLEIRKKLLAGDTCTGVQSRQYSRGSSFHDLEFSPDGQRLVISPDGTGFPGVVIGIDSGRYYITDANKNQSYLNEKYYESGYGPETNAYKQPYGVAILPQKLNSNIYPWGTIIVNKGSGTDTDEDSLLLWLTSEASLPYFAHYDVIDTNIAGVPTCYGGADATVSNLGERAFIGFTNTNNIGATGALEGNTNDIRCATSANAFAGSLREVAYTPNGNKVLATIFATTQTDSRVMILDATTIPMDCTGTISSSHYVLRSDSSINGPEGIGLQPLFDRDGDKISDLIEAFNLQDFLIQFGATTTITLDPIIPDLVVSEARGTTTNGFIFNSVRLPEEGIGYRHFYGNTTDFNNGDNYGTLKLIKIIEAVGREWNQKHPNGPRISIGDLSLNGGGQFYPGNPQHAEHQQGLNADIRYVRNDGGEGPLDIVLNPGDYSQSLTQDLVYLFCKSGTDKILVNNSSNLNGVPGCTLTLRTDHTDHFHIKIRWP